MSKFKAGDKVRCIDSSLSENFLKYGGIYIISDRECIFGDEVYLEGSKCSWLESRFELVNETPFDQYIKDTGTQLVEGIKDYYSKERVMPIIDVADYPPLMGGTKNDESKPDLSLIPTDALWGMASALTFGANKYQRHNFRNGLAFSRLVAATMRHLSAWNEGENLDKESSLSHLDHALASLAMLKFMDVNRQDMDDRWLNPIHEHNQEVLTEEEKLEAAKEFQNRGR